VRRQLAAAAGFEAGKNYLVVIKATTDGVATIQMHTFQVQDTAADVKTAMEANGSKLDHLWEMTEDDAGTRRLTANALEQEPVKFGVNPVLGETYYGGNFAITPHNTNYLARETRAISVDVTGTLAVTMDDGTEIGFSPAAGIVHHGLRIKRVKATGTSATGIVGWY
jgi:hypothetical protein